MGAATSRHSLGTVVGVDEVIRASTVRGSTFDQVVDKDGLATIGGGSCGDNLMALA